MLGNLLLALNASALTAFQTGDDGWVTWVMDCAEQILYNENQHQNVSLTKLITHIVSHDVCFAIIDFNYWVLSEDVAFCFVHTLTMNHINSCPCM